MNKNKQILMTMLAAIIIAATSIFTGCNKNKAEVTGVTVCPVAEMVRVGNNTIFTEFLTYSPKTGEPDLIVWWTSSNPKVASVGSQGIVNAHTIGETVITCRTKDGDFTASATVIVNPIEIDDDYATIVPYFYFGNTKINDETVDIYKLVTVKYALKNKIVYSIDETFKLPRTGGYVELSLKADVPAVITKMDGYNTFHAVCEVELTIGKTSDPTILHLDGTFTPGGELNLTITFKNLPDMEDVTLNFKGDGRYKIDCPLKL